MVTESSFDSPVLPALHKHEGQEFNYVVSGSMEFHLGEMTYVLEEGDSIYFDSSIPHAYKALGRAPAKFLAIVIKNPYSRNNADE